MVQFKSRWIGKATNFKSLTCKSFGRDLFLKKCECVFVNVEGASVCGGLLVILFCPTDKRALVKGSGENTTKTQHRLKPCRERRTGGIEPPAGAPTLSQGCFFDDTLVDTLGFLAEQFLRAKKFTRRGTWCRWRWPRRRRHGQPCRGRWRA